MNYRFNKEQHLHQAEVDGEWKNLTGCTTILSVVSKPALIQWAANMAINYIKENAPYVPETKLYMGVNDEILESARKAHAQRKTDAGTYGTETHAQIEKIVKNAIDHNGGIIGEGTLSPDKSLQNFITWAITNKVKFLDSERNIYSEKLWLGGIVDFICEIDHNVWIGDIKTAGSGIYPEFMWQCAGYHLMLKEMGLYPKVKGYLILNLKESGEMLEKRSISNADNIKAFKACLDIYRVKEKLNKTI